MPTTLGSRPLVREARLRLDVGSYIVIILMSLLFAGAYWAAFAPRPMPDAQTASVPAGL